MKFTDTLLLSTRMFTTRTMRTLLTILGVGVGIGAVLFLVSLGYGLQNVILSQITTADALLSLDVSPGPSELVQLDHDNIENISKIENVTEVSRAKSMSAQLTLGGLTADTALTAIDHSYFRLGGIKADIGKIPDENNAREIVISAATAQLFDLGSNEILGKKMQLTYFIQNNVDDKALSYEDIEIIQQEEPYTVVGVIANDSTSIAFLTLDHLDTGSIDNFDRMKVKVSDEAVSQEVRNRIIEQGFIVSALSDVIEQARKIFRVVQIILGLFGLIALVVSAIGMFNTMTIALLERTNEIGIMRSIGITKRDIRILFLIESMIMGFLGGLGGVMIGYLAGEGANLGINILAKNLGGQALDLFVQPIWFVGIILVFSTVVGLLTGFFPARRAANMDPLEALRYK